MAEKDQCFKFNKYFLGQSSAGGLSKDGFVDCLALARGDYSMTDGGEVWGWGVGINLVSCSTVQVKTQVNLLSS